MAKPLVLKVGAEYGRLTVLGLAERMGCGKTKRLWRCRCKCGALVNRSAGALVSANTRSCGCLHREELGNRRRKHGHSGRSEYLAWLTMISRCYHRNCPDYSYYGERGIRVCAEWRSDYLAFIRDLGLKSGSEYTLERIDVNGDYCPGNCRWATRKEQSRNTRRNRRLTIDGITKVVAEWAECSGTRSTTIIQRLNNGWDHKSAVFLPPDKGRRKKQTSS